MSAVLEVSVNSRLDLLIYSCFAVALVARAKPWSSQTRFRELGDGPCLSSSATSPHASALLLLVRLCGQEGFAAEPNSSQNSSLLPLSLSCKYLEFTE